MNRPYPGCGCLWVVAILLVLYWLISVLFPPRPLQPGADPTATEQRAPAQELELR
jgi:hypothetical protein